MTRKKVTAPVRIDFGGGATDIAPFTYTHGGAVLNAAINKYITGELIATDERVGLKYSGNIPTSSGLGTSGVMNLVWLALISKTKDKIRLAETVYGLEQGMGVVGGKQDQYASALGGINFFEFKGDKVEIIRLRLKKRVIRELEEKLVLVYTGKPHYQANKPVIEDLKKGKNTQNLLSIKRIALEMKDALLEGNLLHFAELMNEETMERKKLHSSIVPQRIGRIIQSGMKNGAIGAKICGSGNGGCVLFFCNDPLKLKKNFKGKIIEFKFDWKGLRWN